MIQIKDYSEKKEVRIVKFITEYRVYPNGDIYFSKQYPIGESSYKPKQKKKKVVLEMPSEIGSDEI